MNECKYCNFKSREYGDDKEATLGFYNAWSGASLIECTKTRSNDAVEGRILYKQKCYLTVGGDDFGYFEIHYCPMCGRKLGD